MRPEESAGPAPQRMARSIQRALMAIGLLAVVLTAAAAAVLFHGAYGVQVDRDLERMTRAVAVGYQSAETPDPESLAGYLPGSPLRLTLIDAYGSVLFIDEAYSLYLEDGSMGRSYGTEAIDTLIAQMENHRDDFVVIMAGYPDEMQKLMEANAGLAGRMPYTVTFGNFTRGQLYEIFAKLVKRNFAYSQEVLALAEQYFNALPEEVLSAKDLETRALRATCSSARGQRRQCAPSLRAPRR